MVNGEYGVFQKFPYGCEGNAFLDVEAGHPVVQWFLRGWGLVHALFYTLWRSKDVCSFLIRTLGHGVSKMGRQQGA